MNKHTIHSFRNRQAATFVRLISHSVIYLACLLWIISCGEAVQPALTEIDLGKAFTSKQTIAIEDISTEVRFVPLETKDDVLIKYISKVLLTDDKIIVIHDNKCSLFDLSGRFIRTVGSKGQGPAEYLSMYDVNVTGDLIMTFNESDHRLLTYKQNGEFVGALKLPTDVLDVCINGSTIYGFIPNMTGKETNRLKCFNLDGTVRDSVPAVQYENPSGISLRLYPEGSFFVFGKEILLKEFLNDTVFQVTPDCEMIPRYRLNFGEYTFKTAERYQIENPQMNILKGKKAINRWLESSHYLFMYGLGTDDNMLFLLDKPSRKLIYTFILYGEAEKQLFEKDYFMPRYISEDNTTLISYEQPADIEDDSNPTVVLVKLKK